MEAEYILFACYSCFVLDKIPFFRFHFFENARNFLQECWVRVYLIGVVRDRSDIIMHFTNFLVYLSKNRMLFIWPIY